MQRHDRRQRRQRPSAGDQYAARAKLRHANDGNAQEQRANKRRRWREPNRRIGLAAEDKEPSECCDETSSMQWLKAQIAGADQSRRRNQKREHKPRRGHHACRGPRCEEGHAHRQGHRRTWREIAFTRVGQPARGGERHRCGEEQRVELRRMHRECECRPQRRRSRAGPRCMFPIREDCGQHHRRANQDAGDGDVGRGCREGEAERRRSGERRQPERKRQVALRLGWPLRRRQPPHPRRARGGGLCARGGRAHNTGRDCRLAHAAALFQRLTQLSHLVLERADAAAHQPEAGAECECLQRHERWEQDRFHGGLVAAASARWRPFAGGSHPADRRRR